MTFIVKQCTPNCQGDNPPAGDISSVTAGALAGNQALSKTCITSVRQNWRWVYQVGSSWLKANIFIEDRVALKAVYGRLSSLTICGCLTRFH